MTSRSQLYRFVVKIHVISVAYLVVVARQLGAIASPSALVVGACARGHLRGHFQVKHARLRDLRCVWAKRMRPRALFRIQRGHFYALTLVTRMSALVTPLSSKHRLNSI